MTAIDCGTIYKYTSPSGKVYIGQTTEPVEVRWKAYRYLNCKSQPRLYNSFMKYGYENHAKEVIMTGITSKEMLDFYEMFYIAVYDATGENGLNCTIGGEGRFIPEEKLEYGMRYGDKSYQKVWRDAHKEKLNAKTKAWKKANPEKVKVYDKAWRKANPDKVKAHKKSQYERHKEEKKAKVKAYYKEHKGERKVYNKLYREKEKEIRIFFGYKTSAWKALPSDMRAQMRAKYEEETKQTTLF